MHLFYKERSKLENKNAEKNGQLIIESINAEEPYTSAWEMSAAEDNATDFLQLKSD